MFSSNLLFIFLVILSPVISLSSSDWVISWMGMEIGMFSVIPLLLSKSSSNEPVMKYFLIQSLGSALILISGISLVYHMYEYLYIVLFTLGMSMKLGFFPGHFWVVSIIENLSWFSCMLILGPLKIAPFGIMSMFSDKSFLVMFALFTIFIGAILGFNQSNVRGMLAASSITHSGWMILAMSFGFLWLYMLTYMIVLLYTLMSLNSHEFQTTSVCLLSMSGLPPFILFLVKMKVFYYLVSNLEYLLFTILIVSSVISLFYYLKFFY
uniref:NADH-ubiquinone oxidoreductase chain 2 n=1 Tax=Gyraulus laevis TaxID=1201560 RepID=A0A7D7A5A7_9GAST|nr:NADH dehydrogenase subunit 2 [Gyraulus laevis]